MKSIIVGKDDLQMEDIRGNEKVVRDAQLESGENRNKVEVPNFSSANPYFGQSCQSSRPTSVSSVTSCLDSPQEKTNNPITVVTANSISISSPLPFSHNLLQPVSSAFKQLNGNNEAIDSFHQNLLTPCNKHILENSSNSIKSPTSVFQKSKAIPGLLHEIKKIKNCTKIPKKIKLRIISMNQLTEEMAENNQCKFCLKKFNTGQALGGHMSRKHSGKSSAYNHKKGIRKKREFERMRLLLAKRKYFSSLGQNYETLMNSPEGKKKAKELMSRSRIKKIKKALTDDEVHNFIDTQ
jgi:hypothetical protein